MKKHLLFLSICASTCFGKSKTYTELEREKKVVCPQSMEPVKVTGILCTDDNGTTKEITPSQEIKADNKCKVNQQIKALDKECKTKNAGKATHVSTEKVQDKKDKHDKKGKQDKKGQVLK